MEPYTTRSTRWRFSFLSLSRAPSALSGRFSAATTHRTHRMVRTSGAVGWQPRRVVGSGRTPLAAVNNSVCTSSGGANRIWSMSRIGPVIARVPYLVACYSWPIALPILHVRGAWCGASSSNQQHGWLCGCVIRLTKGPGVADAVIKARFSSQVVSAAVKFP